MSSSNKDSTKADTLQASQDRLLVIWEVILGGGKVCSSDNDSRATSWAPPVIQIEVEGYKCCKGQNSKGCQLHCMELTSQQCGSPKCSRYWANSLTHHLAPVQSAEDKLHSAA